MREPASRARLGADLQSLQRRVVVRRIVVEERHATRPGLHRDVDRVFHRGVTPPHALAILLLAVLRVVDDEVRVLHERDVPLVAGMVQDAVLRLPERLMVRDVGEGGAVAGDPVRDRRRGVIQVLRLDQHVADAEEAFLELGEVDARAQIAQLDGEVRVLHLPGHRFLEALLKAERRVDVELDAGNEGRNEERKALDVIPMGMADEKVQKYRWLQGLCEVQPELTRAGATVEHDDGPVRRANFCARGVAAIARRAIARRGDGATGTPEPDVHSAPQAFA